MFVEVLLFSEDFIMDDEVVIFVDDYFVVGSGYDLMVVINYYVDCVIYFDQGFQVKVVL